MARNRMLTAMICTGRCVLQTSFVCVLLCSLSPHASAAPDSSRSSSAVVPDPSVSAGGLHRILFGDLWRDVWTLPVYPPVVDADGGMDSANGQAAVPPEGMVQIRSAGAPRRAFNPLLRPLDVMFNAEFRELYAPGLLEDLRAMLQPYAPLLADPILDATAVLHPHPRFIARRTRTQGTASVRLEPGFETTLPDGDLIDSYELLRRLQRGGAGAVDAAGFLAARILALYLGDWEQGLAAWAWRVDGPASAPVFEPVLLNPSHAFTRFDGLIPWAGTFFLPSVESWGGGASAVQRALWSGRHLDRWLLSPLSRAVWDSVTAVTASRLTDSVITSAIGALPEPVQARIGAALVEQLTSRRGVLPRMVDDFYARCARVVDIHGTDLADAADITRLDDQRVRVRLTSYAVDASGMDTVTLCDRTFLSSETDEVRVLLNGGDDHALIRGHVRSSIPVRVICGAGKDVVIDSSLVDGCLLGVVPFTSDAENSTYVYAAPEANIEAGAGTVVRRVDPGPVNDTLRFAPAREDRGHLQTWTGMFDWNSEFGPMVGIGPTVTSFDYDTRPFRSQVSILAGVAPFAGVGRVIVRTEWRGVVRNAALLLDASATGFEVLTYFGHGNETRPALSPDDAYYRVRQTQVRMEPALRWPADGPFTVTVRSEFRVIITNKGERKFVTDERPYGIADMALATFGGGLRWDTRDDDVHPFSGAYIDISGSYIPKAFSVGAPYGRIRGDARFFATTGGPVPVTFSMRLLGTHTLGKVPYFDAATIGSSTALRGYQQARFTGASSVVGVAEARVRLGRINFITPTMFGVLGFAESGRVFEPGEGSTVWHPSFGGGVWAAPWRRDATLTASIGISKESVLVYGSVGFGF